MSNTFIIYDNDKEAPIKIITAIDVSNIVFKFHCYLITYKSLKYSILY